MHSVMCVCVSVCLYVIILVMKISQKLMCGYICKICSRHFLHTTLEIIDFCADDIEGG